MTPRKIAPWNSLTTEQKTEVYDSFFPQEGYTGLVTVPLGDKENRFLARYDNAPRISLKLRNYNKPEHLLVGFPQTDHMHDFTDGVSLPRLFWLKDKSIYGLMRAFPPDDGGNFTASFNYLDSVGVAALAETLGKEMFYFHATVDADGDQMASGLHGLVRLKTRV